LPAAAGKLADFVGAPCAGSPQQLGRARPVAAGRVERHGKKLALHFAEREAGLPIPGFPVRRRRGRAGTSCFPTSSSRSGSCHDRALPRRSRRARQCHRPPHEVPNSRTLPGQAFVRDEPPVLARSADSFPARHRAGRNARPVPERRRALAQRRQRQWNHIQSIVKVGAGIGPRRPRLQADGWWWQSPDIDAYVWFDPKRFELALLRARSNLGCSASGTRHFIEQQRSAVRRPRTFRTRADRPVNAPRACPNNSLSSGFSGTRCSSAPQTAPAGAG